MNNFKVSGKSLLLGGSALALALLLFSDTKTKETVLKLDEGFGKNDILVRYALENEEDATRLRSFSESLLPDYPIASGLLLAKAKFIESGGPNNIQIGQFTSWLSDTFKSLGKVAWWVVRTSTPIWMVQTVNRAFSKSRDASGALSDALKEQARISRAIAPIISTIPGIGAGVAIAINTATGLAVGDRISDIAIDNAIAVAPGGLLVRRALQTASEAGKAVLKGQRLDQAALTTARNLLPADPPTIRATFDGILALAYGKSLQDAGFKSLYSFTRGNDILDRALHFTEKVVQANQQRRPVGELLIEDLQSDLKRYTRFQVENQLKPLVSDILRDPNLLTITPNQLARQKGVPEEIARAAQASIRPINAQENILTVNPYVFEKLSTSGLVEIPRGLSMIEQIRLQAFTPRPDPDRLSRLQRRAGWFNYYEKLLGIK